MVNGPSCPRGRVLFFVALLLLDHVHTARVVKQHRNAIYGGLTQNVTETVSGSPDKEREEKQGKTQEEPSVDEAENAILQYEQLKDPHKPIVNTDWSQWKHGQRWLDEFSRVTGLRGKKRDQAYAQAVRNILPDHYISDAAQFALCVRVSSSIEEGNHSAIRVKCTQSLNLLPSSGGCENGVCSLKNRNRRLNFIDVWKGLRDLVDNVEIPNINFSNDVAYNLYRGATNWITGKKDRFKREQSLFDSRFDKYFQAEATATSLSFVKETTPLQHMEKLLNFNAQSGATDATIAAMQRIGTDWPGKEQSSMGSRYLLCFGSLAENGKKEVTPEKIAEHCTGFWNKVMTKAAVVGLGKSLSWNGMTGDGKMNPFRDYTLFQVRMEILYGRSKADSLKKAFWIVGSGGSSRGLAKTIAKLVRERISREGLKVEECHAKALSLTKLAKKGKSSGSSLIGLEERNSAARSTG
eukprot:gnl/MRDRNA2_/MRDRNA2_75352_c0_seq2.p1 gnl/MRDRNA2_/MRDRNA2_75352_c0~~gnl/MRDRNA2_/MRDRNA2_75352_c0_seq2.p1  ORF type:complete len:466 (+),score=93.09 gnl/MRDRNA2_/MRDRNA2_75352_c0_seq2:91-1488(+)